MKKTITILLMIAVSTSLNAQNDSCETTESLQYVELGFPGGLNYTYEYAFHQKFSIAGRAGLTGKVGYESSSFLDESYHNWYYAVSPYIEIEPRYYYNLCKRARNGKKTERNTGSFWALRTGATFNPIVKHETEMDGGIYIAPCWGLRRTWGKHWIFEFEAGLTFGKDKNNESGMRPLLGVNLGFNL